MSTCPTDQKWNHDPQESNEDKCTFCELRDTSTEPVTGAWICDSCIKDFGKFLEHDEETDIFKFEYAYYDGEFHMYG